MMISMHVYVYGMADIWVLDGVVLGFDALYICRLGINVLKKHTVFRAEDGKCLFLQMFASTYEFIRHQNPEEEHCHSHHHENLKYHIWVLV
jgi:hypothetical protein